MVDLESPEVHASLTAGNADKREDSPLSVYSDLESELHALQEGFETTSNDGGTRSIDDQALKISEYIAEAEWEKSNDRNAFTAKVSEEVESREIDTSSIKNGVFKWHFSQPPVKGVLIDQITVSSSLEDVLKNFKALSETNQELSHCYWEIEETGHGRRIIDANSSGKSVWVGKTFRDTGLEKTAIYTCSCCKRLTFWGQRCRIYATIDGVRQRFGGTTLAPREPLMCGVCPKIQSLRKSARVTFLGEG